MKQFVLPDSVPAGESRLRLEGGDYHYLIRVRRCSEGDRIRGITRDGRRYSVTFLTVDTSYCDVLLSPLESETDPESVDVDSDVRIVLMPGITKGKKMDLTVRQAVEAGAGAVLPILTDHCQVRYQNAGDASAKQERWERIATEALQQCGGMCITEIGIPAGLIETVTEWGDRGPLLFLHEKVSDSDRDGAGLFRRLAEPPRELGIIVGPEGGLSPSETAFLLNHGAEPVYLGSRILRAETAALYGMAVVATIIRERSEWHPA